MKKLTILALVLVLCLGALGVSYSAWTDEVQIDGTITTGCVDLDVTKYSGTWVYKDMETDALVRDSGWVDIVNPPRDPSRYLLVGYAVAAPGANNNEIVITFWNLFPGEMFRADFQLHYAGTIPAIVDFEYDIADDWIEDLYTSSPQYIRVNAWTSSATGPYRISPLPLEPLQMHTCDYVVVDIEVKIPQDPAYECLSGSFTATITATQWNEYPDNT